MVYWIMSLIISCMILIAYCLFNRLNNEKINGSSYYYLLFVVMFFNYFSRNFLDFNYHNHSCARIKDTINIIKSNYT
jgi:hypothetical protein